MKKRSVKKQAREAEKIILEKNKEWIDDFITQNYSNETKTSKKKNISSFAIGKPKKFVGKSHTSVVIIGTLTSFIAIGLVVAVALILMFNQIVPNPSIPKKHYMTENEKIAESDIAELNSKLNTLSLKLNEGYERKVNRIYDTVSNDTLYYNLDLVNQETTERIRVYVYVNNDFENQKKITDVDNVFTQTVGVFEIQYTEEKIDEDWVFFLKYKAITKNSDVPIYIEYEQYSLDGTSNFFNFIEQTFNVT